jgi:Family of unknown function (DUF5343)
MGDFTYTTVPGKIKPLLDKIRQVGVPQKASVQWLKTIGFTSSNDTTLLGILKTAGLADPSGVPTSIWTQFRGTHHRRVLGDAIRTGYAELFAVYQDAWQRTNTELEHVFSTSSSAGKQVITKTVATFKALCECAEFAEQTAVSMSSGPVHMPVASHAANSVQHSAQVNHSPSVHIDIQIHISPEASSDQIDQIFKSMAKHLYGPRVAE